MGETVEVFLGFDPGGANPAERHGSFGWCVCQVVDEMFAYRCSGLGRNAGDVVEQVSGELAGNDRVLGVGIDAPMFWSVTGEVRSVDDIIRDEGAQVQQVNSLTGACLVQGILVGATLYQRFKAPITEVHPRALRHLLRDRSADNVLPAELERYEADLRRSPNDNENHEWDALAAAYAAWRMYQRDPEWRDLFPEEPNPILPLGTPVSYWMPIP